MDAVLLGFFLGIGLSIGGLVWFMRSTVAAYSSKRSLAAVSVLLEESFELRVPSASRLMIRTTATKPTREARSPGVLIEYTIDGAVDRVSIGCEVKDARPGGIAYAFVSRGRTKSQTNVLATLRGACVVYGKVTQVGRCEIGEIEVFAKI